MLTEGKTNLKQQYTYEAGFRSEGGACVVLLFRGCWEGLSLLVEHIHGNEDGHHPPEGD